MTVTSGPRIHPARGLIGPLALLAVACLQAPASGQAPDRSKPASPGAGFEDFICPTCEDLLPEKLIAKHLAGIPRKQRPGTDRCVASCRFLSPQDDVVVGASCGLKNQKADRKAAAKPDPTLGLLAELREKPNELRMVAWDDDTPCALDVWWIGPDARTRALALAKDLASAVTPAALTRKSGEVVVAAEDASGDRARALQSSWTSLAPALNALIDWRGAPRLAEPPELPAGKKALGLAQCPNGAGQGLVDLVRPIFPDARWYRSATPGAAACPALAEGWELVTKHHFPSTRSGKLELRLAATQAKAGATGKPLARVVGYLFDDQGKLLDWKRVDLDWPAYQEPKAPEPGVSYNKCDVAVDDKPRLRAVRTCAVNYDLVCDKYPERIAERLFKVTGNKIAVEERASEKPGVKCRHID